MYTHPHWTFRVATLLAAVVVLSLVTGPGVVLAASSGSETPCDTPNNPRAFLEEFDSPAIEAADGGIVNALTHVGCLQENA